MFTPLYAFKQYFQGCIFASVVIATFCPPSGRDPCIYQQPLSRKAPPAGGDEDTAAAPGKNGILFIFVLLYRLFFFFLTDSKNLF